MPHPPLIIPEVGAGRQSAIQKTIDAYHKVAERIQALQPQVLVIASPHAEGYADRFVVSAGQGAEGSFAGFGAPQVRLKNRGDADLAGRIARLAGPEGLPLVEEDSALDHGTMVPLYFMRALGLDIPLVRVSISGLSAESHRSLGRCIDRAAQELGRSYVFVASGDLSHKLLKEGPYGYAAQGPSFDRQIREAVEACDCSRFFAFSEDFARQAAECGLRTFQMMAGALEKGDQIRSAFLRGAFRGGLPACGLPPGGRRPGSLHPSGPTGLGALCPDGKPAGTAPGASRRADRPPGRRVCVPEDRRPAPGLHRHDPAGLRQPGPGDPSKRRQRGDRRSQVPAGAGEGAAPSILQRGRAEPSGARGNSSSWTRRDTA